MMQGSYPIAPLMPLSDEQRRLLEFFAIQAQRGGHIIVRWRGRQMRVELTKTEEAKSA